MKYSEYIDIIDFNLTDNIYICIFAIIFALGLLVAIPIYWDLPYYVRGHYITGFNYFMLAIIGLPCITIVNFLLILVLLSLISYPFRYITVRRIVQSGKCFDSSNSEIFLKKSTHDLDGCKCRRCGAIEHLWDKAPQSDPNAQCMRCGKAYCEHDWRYQGHGLWRYTQTDWYKCSECGLSEYRNPD